MTVKSSGGRPKSGKAMEVTAVAALMSLFAFALAIWGLHLRLKSAQKGWKEEAVMVRRKSMALSMAAANELRGGLGVHPEKNNGRWSEVPDYNQSNANLKSDRGSMIKDPIYGEEERLEAELELAKRNSRDQEMMVRRAS